jgi:hypothetical protein
MSLSNASGRSLKERQARRLGILAHKELLVQRTEMYGRDDPYDEDGVVQEGVRVARIHRFRSLKTHPAC